MLVSICMVQVYLSSQLSNVPSIMHAWVNTIFLTPYLQTANQRLETFQNILEASEVAL